ncbi:MAG: LON peptidase substrate-binding domain-containing protein [Acidimicrobiia bacterium]
MFPLGTVLFPYAPLPLHVFEPRYRALVETCLAGEPEFGVVLIERGSEVGGGDERFDVATVARILQVGRADDGRYVLGTVGTRRLRVVRWLDDAPYPRAAVETFDDPVVAPPDPGLRAEVVRLLTHVLALRAELGEAVDVVVALDDESVRASYEAAARAGVGPLDAQELLAAAGAIERLEVLRRMLEDQRVVLEAHLQGPEVG